MTPATLLTNSMVMSGKAVTWKFARTDLLVLQAALAVVVDSAAVALEAVSEAEADLAVAAALEAATVVDEEVLVVEASVVLPELASKPMLLPTRQIPSLTSPHPVESPAALSMFATCLGLPATRILSSCLPQSARWHALRSNTSQTVVPAELALSNSSSKQMLRLLLVRRFLNTLLYLG